MKINLMIVGLVLSLSTSAHSASFDCNKASSFAEREICYTKKISKLDDKLSALYKKVKITEGNWREGQLTWLKERNNCKTTQCVTLAYQSRVLFFESVLAKETKQHFELIESMSGDEYCAGLLDFTNSKYANSAGLISEQLPWQPLKPKKVKFLNGKVGEFYTGEAYLEMDVNGDNKIDTVMRRIAFLNDIIYHYMHVLNNKQIHDLDLIDMQDLKKDWMIDYRLGRGYPWSFGWLDVVTYRGVPIFAHLDSIGDTEQELLYFNIDTKNTRSTSIRIVVGISPLCLMSAKNGFETKYLK